MPRKISMVTSQEILAFQEKAGKLNQAKDELIKQHNIFVKEDEELIKLEHEMVHERKIIMKF